MDRTATGAVEGQPQEVGAKAPQAVPEREVVAIRHEGPHDHIVRVKLVDGTEHAADDVLRSIEAHEAHWFMAHPAGKLLLRGQQCPDCDERVLWA